MYNGHKMVRVTVVVVVVVVVVASQHWKAGIKEVAPLFVLQGFSVKSHGPSGTG